MNLQKSILQTLAYFDIFDQPLTKEELFRYLLITDPLRRSFSETSNTDLRMTYIDFLNQLDGLPGEVRPWRTKSGFYFLSGREQIVDERQRKVKIVEQKLKIAKHGAKKIAWVPFLRAIFVCNTVASWTADENSDIDFFIIAKKGRIWLVRLLSTLTLRMFGLRTYGTKLKNRICLSFFVTDDNLNLGHIALDEDIYLMYWLMQLMPMYDPSRLYQSVINANRWAQKFLPNFSHTIYHITHDNCDRVVGRFFKKIFEKMWGGGYGDLIEAQARGIQQTRLKMKNNHTGVGKNVIISDEIIKLHENDRRVEYRERWVERCKSLL